jgi:hypothetical protein
MSLLTCTAPRIWIAGVTLAQSLTGVTYRPKDVSPDGIVYPCYSGNYYPPPANPRTPEEIDVERRQIARKTADAEILRIEREIERLRDEIVRREKEIEQGNEAIEKLESELEEARKKRDDIGNPTRQALEVFVPVGAMEWLLHEVGHWLAATPRERSLVNYGLPASEEAFGIAADRELQAWAFEEIVLAPWGSARAFAPPSQRDGVGFVKAGPLPEAALRHAEKQIVTERLDVEQWREVYGEWVKWGRPLGRRAPWNAEM